MVGLNAGFFVGLMKGDSKPIEFWTSLVDSDTTFAHGSFFVPKSVTVFGAATDDRQGIGCN
jgi:hypothetical protein